MNVWMRLWRRSWCWRGSGSGRGRCGRSAEGDRHCLAWGAARSGVHPAPIGVPQIRSDNPTGIRARIGVRIARRVGVDFRTGILDVVAAGVADIESNTADRPGPAAAILQCRCDLWNDRRIVDGEPGRIKRSADGNCIVSRRVQARAKTNPVLLRLRRSLLTLSEGFTVGSAGRLALARASGVEDTLDFCLCKRAAEDFCFIN